MVIVPSHGPGQSVNSVGRTSSYALRDLGPFKCKWSKSPGKCCCLPLCPIGAERVGVRWGTLECYVISRPFLHRHPPHPKSFSPLKGGEGLPPCLLARTFAPVTIKGAYLSTYGDKPRHDGFTFPHPSCPALCRVPTSGRSTFCFKQRQQRIDVGPRDKPVDDDKRSLPGPPPPGGITRCC